MGMQFDRLLLRDIYPALPQTRRMAALSAWAPPAADRLMCIGIWGLPDKEKAGIGPGLYPVLVEGD